MATGAATPAGDPSKSLRVPVHRLQPRGAHPAARLWVRGLHRRRGVAEELLDGGDDGRRLLGGGARPAQLEPGAAVHDGGPWTPLIDRCPRARWYVKSCAGSVAVERCLIVFSRLSVH